MNLPIRAQIEELEDSKIVDVWRRGFGVPHFHGTRPNCPSSRNSHG